MKVHVITTTEDRYQVEWDGPVGDTFREYLADRKWIQALKPTTGGRIPFWIRTDTVVAFSVVL